MGIVDPDTPSEDNCIGMYESGNEVCDSQCGIRGKCKIAQIVNRKDNKLDYVLAVMEDETS